VTGHGARFNEGFGTLPCGRRSPVEGGGARRARARAPVINDNGQECYCHG
jgi:hypothetical protein